MMKFIATISLFMLFYSLNHVYAQNRVSRDTSRVHVAPPQSDEVFDIVEDEPMFPGGDEAMQKFIKDNLVYPVEAKQNGEQGKVYIRFVVEVDGSIKDVSIARSVSLSIDAEAMRIVNIMPNWIPGKQRGRPVPTRVVIPVVFVL